MDRLGNPGRGLTREAAKQHILANLTPDEEGDYDMDELDDLAMIIVEEY